MGDPRKLKNKFRPPRKRYDAEAIKTNKILVKKYGLKKTEEIWRAQTLLSNFRRRARELIATKNEAEEKALFNKMLKYGLIDKNSTIDDILDLQLENILDRQLAPIVLKKGLANTIKQARQFIVHGHIMVDGQKITSPRYLVPVDKEGKITYHNGSNIPNVLTKPGENKVPKDKPKEAKDSEVKEEKASVNETKQETDNKADEKNDEQKQNTEEISNSESEKTEEPKKEASEEKKE